MLGYLREGMTLFHKTNRTQAIITELDEKNITIKLSKEIANKKKLGLPITHIGEWLFYKEHEIDLKPEELVGMPQYLTYGNQKLLELQKKKIRSRKNGIAKLKIFLNEEK